MTVSGASCGAMRNQPASSGTTSSTGTSAANAQRRPDPLGDAADERSADDEAHVVEDVDAGDRDAARGLVVGGGGRERERDRRADAEPEHAERHERERRGRRDRQCERSGDGDEPADPHERHRADAVDVPVDDDASDHGHERVDAVRQRGGALAAAEPVVEVDRAPVRRPGVGDVDAHERDADQQHRTPADVALLGVHDLDRGVPRQQEPPDEQLERDGDDGDRREEHPERQRGVGGERREDRADESGEAERRVVRGDDAVADVVLHADALDVHRRVHRAEADADDHHPGDEHRDALCESDRDQPERCDRPHHPQHDAAAALGREPTCDDASDAGHDGHKAHHETELTVGEVESGLQRGDARDEGCEAHALHDERHGDGETRTRQVDRLRVRVGAWVR